MIARVLARVCILLLLPSSMSAAALRWETNAGFRVAEVAPGQPHRTGFTLLPPAQTGVRFTNYLSLGAAVKNHNLMQGAGVAAGDFDNDGWCDLYFANVEGRNTLYRNRGGLVFEDVTETAGVACPGMFSTGTAFADVNGDGWLDLFVAGNNGPNALFLNLGNGRFTNVTSAAGLTSAPLGATSVAFADLDGNGALDLFVANYGENTLLRSGGEVRIRMVNGKPVVSGRAARRWKIVDGKLIEFGEPSAVYLNDGRGRFRALSWTDGTFVDEDGQPLRELPMDLSLSVALRDINGDGAPDIYVCNDFQTPDRIWINDGRARFRALPRLAMRQMSHFSMGVDFADIDRDGRDDFIVVDMLSRRPALKMTQMIDTNLMASLPGAISDRPQIRRNALFWNRGDGTYADIANFAGVDASDWTWTPAFLDVDLDGYEDLLVSNGHAFDTQDLDTAERPVTQGGTKQIASYPRLETPNYLFRNRGNRTFEELGASWGFSSTQVCHGVVFGDLDNDGDLEAIVSSLNAPALVYRNDSPAPRVTVRLKGRAPNTRGLGARIQVRGGAVPLQSQQMVCGGRYLSADEPVRTFAAGSVSNRMTIEVTWQNGRRSIVTNALANRVYEIDEVGSQSAPPVRVEPQVAPIFEDRTSTLAHKHQETAFDDFARQPLLAKKLSQLGPGVGWIDFDGDGRDELVIGAARGGALAVLRSAANGFTAAKVGEPAGDDLLGLTRWATGGKPAMLVARAAYEISGAGTILSSSASGGGFVAGAIATTADSPRVLAASEIDGSGSLQVFSSGIKAGRYPESVPPQILREEKTRLVPQMAYAPIIERVGLVSAATWSDLEGDGFPELIVACEWGPIRIFKNQRGQLSEATAALKMDAWLGWWTSVTTGDLDGDGRLDVIAGNWGLNSPYRASPELPERLYYGDLAGDGTVHLLETEYDLETKTFRPRENLTVLAPVMPFLRGKYPTHASFRQATVATVLGERAASARELRATTLATTVFFNRGDHFLPMVLPDEAQWAPVFGISVADLDGDGDQDLFLAQNFFATRKEIPRLDGGRGLWLRNDGAGTFHPMTAAESGVAIWGEQRGSAVGDYDQDGRVDLVVTQNSAETRLFQNRVARPGLRIRFKGPPGNPEGLGAVARLKYANGFGPACEVRGGAGYMSQDSATLVLGMREKPVGVAVRWAGGRTLEVPVPAGAREIVIPFAQ
jgi:hypothetical protein